MCKPEEVTAGPCPPEASGENDAVGKKITIFDNAFKTSTTRYGTSSWVAMAVAHEVGHQADFAPLGTAFAQFRRTNDEAKVPAARSRSDSAWIKHARNGRNLFLYTEVGGGATTGSLATHRRQCHGADRPCQRQSQGPNIPPVVGGSSVGGTSRGARGTSLDKRTQPPRNALDDCTHHQG